MTRVDALPEIVVERDGVPLSTRAARSLSSVRVERRLNAPALCELCFDEPGEPAFDLVRARAGAALRIGLRTGSEPLFEGEITAFEERRDEARGRTVRWRAYDLLHRLRKRQPVRAHVEVTLVDLARELAAPHGLSVECEHESPTWRRVLQVEETDLDLIIERARRAGLHVSLRGTALRLVALDGLGEAVVLRLGRELRDAEIELNAEAGAPAVRAHGWDLGRGEEFTAEMSLSSARTIGVFAPDPSLVGAEARSLVNVEAESAREVELFAQAALESRAARGAVLRAIADGDARLHPSTRVEIHGLSTGAPALFALTSVIHHIDAGVGFVTEIASDPPAPPARDPRATATLGTVSDTSDPERFGRVRVQLSGHGGVETDWLQVALPAAGSGKGLVALPDVGDRVILVALDGDLDRSVVIGGIFASGGLADQEARSDSRSRLSLRTKSGQGILFDAARDIVRIEDARGSYVELAAAHVHLHAKSALTLEAPGQQITLRADRIDFERG